MKRKNNLELFKFHELGSISQNCAIEDYLTGWHETHEENDLSHSEVREILLDDHETYFDEKGIMQ
jgi:hypothetical protein